MTATPGTRGGSPPADPRMPGTALAAVVVGFLGVLPTAFLALVAIGLGGLTADDGPDPWTWLVLLAPVLQLAGAVWLLTRRGWLPQVLAVVPVAVLTGAVIWAASSADDAGGLGWPLLLVVLPLAAAVLAATPRVRRWVAGRPRGARERRPPR